MVVGMVAMLAQSAPAAETSKAATPAATASAAPGAIPGLPEGWNTKIPIPPGATVASKGSVEGAITNIEFLVPGDLDTLVNFYMTGLKKSGFKMGTPIKMAARKAFNVTFEEKGTLNSLSIYPADKDPSKFTVHVTYVPTNLKPTARPSGTPGAIPTNATSGKALY